jgi:hypothetical protein
MKLVSQLGKAHKLEVKALQLELDEEREKFFKNFKSLEEINKDTVAKLDNERKNSKEQKKFWDAQLEDARLAITGNSQEFSNIQKRLREENLELSQKIAELTQKPSLQVVQPNLDGLKDVFLKMIKEGEMLKQEKAVNECRLEYEMKISSKI